jgi:hypothetical protein
LEIEVTEDMTGPLSLYYEVDNFYQNHKKILQSGHIQQMRTGMTGDNEDSFAGKGMWHASVVKNRMPGCYPWWSTKHNNINDGPEKGNKVFYPCGLRAANVFNDTFLLLGEGSEPAILDLKSDAEAVSFWGDHEYKFKNLNPEGKYPAGPWNDATAKEYGATGDMTKASKDFLPGKEYQEVLDMWLTSCKPGITCMPPTRCKNDKLGTLKPTSCRNYGGWRKSVPDWQKLGDKRAQCVFQGSFVNILTGQTEQGKDCQQEPVPEGWGVENTVFINWMRVSAFPTFKKLYGNLDMSLKKGRKLQIRAKSQFPMQQLQGRKSLVLSTQQWTGQPQVGGGIIFLVFGISSVLLGLFFFFLTVHRPHHLASIEFLEWKGGLTKKS